MAVGSSALSHRFVVAQDICTLFVELPFLSSFEDVELDVGCEAVRIGLPGESLPRHVTWPAEVGGRQDIEKSSARFSRKNAQLIVKLPLASESDVVSAQTPVEKPLSEKSDVVSVQKPVEKPLSVTCEVSKNVQRLRDLEEKQERLRDSETKRLRDLKEKQESLRDSETTQKQEISKTASQHLRVSEEKVLGSGWNANSWHWEERPMIKWSQSWFEDELNSVSLPILDGLAHLRFLDTADILKGEISLSVRKGRPIVLYELTGMCRWVTDPRPGSDFHTRGKIWIKDFTSDEGAVEGVDSATLEVDVSIDTTEGRRVSKAVKVDLARHMRLTLKRFLEALVSQAAAPKA